MVLDFQILFAPIMERNTMEVPNQYEMVSAVVERMIIKWNVDLHSRQKKERPYKLTFVVRILMLQSMVVYMDSDL